MPQVITSPDHLENMKPSFEDKFIAYIDILGFKQLVVAAEAADDIELADLLDLVGKLSAAQDQAELATNGPMICPGSSFRNRNLLFRSTQVSDCVIISAEVSPAGVANFIGRCWGVTVRLLDSGVLCRGYITRGAVFHSDTQILGSGYQRAYRGESQVTAFKRAVDEQGTPFVEIDPAVTDYVRKCGDPCAVEIYDRCTESDGELDALFPFRSLEQSFIIGGPYAKFINYDEIRQGNVALRSDIATLKSKLLSGADQNDARAVQKVKHYVRALDRQLGICDEVDQVLDAET